MSRAGFGRAVVICEQASLVLAGCLPILVPSDPARNIDMQGMLLIVSGGLAWSALLFGGRRVFGQLGRLESWLLGIFSLCCVVSLAVNPQLGNDFFGAPYIRLGTAGLLSCIGIGLLLARLPYKSLLTGLYLIIATVSLVSVPYSWWHSGSLWRVGGIFSQADIFACWVSCGLLLGLEMWHFYPRWRKYLLTMAVIWAGLLILSETRAVLVIVLILGLLWTLQKRLRHKLRLIAVYILAALLVVSSLHYLAPNRLTSSTYASQSVSYRLTLQDYALKAAWHKPWLGWGPGNVATALSCQRLTAQTLQATCRQGYFFNSSHNIFLDRVLMIGWLGGLSFAGIVLLAIRRGLATPNKRNLAYIGVLIACYYLTNVTSLTLELLFWVILLRIIHRPLVGLKKAEA